jgi:hypothetical protein
MADIYKVEKDIRQVDPRPSFLPLYVIHFQATYCRCPFLAALLSYSTLRRSRSICCINGRTSTLAGRILLWEESCNDLYFRLCNCKLTLCVPFDLRSGWDHTLAITPYNERFRQMRRLLHEVLSPRPAHMFRPIQEQENTSFLNRLLKTPEHFVDHIRQCACIPLRCPPRSFIL